VLMENAGRVVVEEIMKMGDSYKSILIVSGLGKNGGDGFVIARHLVNQGKRVVVAVAGNPKNIEGDSLENLNILKKLEIQVDAITDLMGIAKLEKYIRSADMVVDCLIGTGLDGNVTGFMDMVINCINDNSKYTLSVDIPSGVNASTGHIMNNAIKASRTVSLVIAKVGNILYPGTEYNGELIIKGIGVPDKILNDVPMMYQLTEEVDIIPRIPHKKRNSNKGDYGKAHVIAGSQGMTGAAILTCRAALRTGLGMLKLYIPESLNVLITTSIPEVITIPLQEMRKGIIGLNHLNKIIEDSEKASVFAIGPGCGNTAEMVELIRRILMEVSIPMVIDADGLNALSKNVEWLSTKRGEVILTPHTGEMARLTGLDVEYINSHPIDVARDFSTKWGVITVLKGSRTVIAQPDGTVNVNMNGNPGMATAGSGDVLTGIITGLIAQGLKPKDAAVVGVYLHGMSGDIMVEEKGDHGLLAGDLIEGMTLAFKELTKHEMQTKAR
jgi:ADP-dependent NAD(P)H-hydrate dehydratase / NAD(P)H-hydrate epimerase